MSQSRQSVAQNNNMEISYNTITRNGNEDTKDHISKHLDTGSDADNAYDDFSLPDFFFETLNIEKMKQASEMAKTEDPLFDLDEFYDFLESGETQSLINNDIEDMVEATLIDDVINEQTLIVTECTDTISYSNGNEPNVALKYDVNSEHMKEFDEILNSYYQKEVNNFPEQKDQTKISDKLLHKDVMIKKVAVWDPVTVNTENTNKTEIVETIHVRDGVAAKNIAVFLFTYYDKKGLRENTRNKGRFNVDDVIVISDSDEDSELTSPTTKNATATKLTNWVSIFPAQCKENSNSIIYTEKDENSGANLSKTDLNPKPELQDTPECSKATQVTHFECPKPSLKTTHSECPNVVLQDTLECPKTEFENTDLARTILELHNPTECSTSVLQDTPECPKIGLQEASESPKKLLQNTSDFPNTIQQDTSECPKMVLQVKSECPNAVLLDTLEFRNAVLQDTLECAKAVLQDTSECPKVVSQDTSECPKVVSQDTSECPKVVSQDTSKCPKFVSQNTSERLKTVSQDTAECSKTVLLDTPECPKVKAEEDSECEGYHSSDFEFITESDAEKGGLITRQPSANPRRRKSRTPSQKRSHSGLSKIDSEKLVAPRTPIRNRNYYRELRAQFEMAERYKTCSNHAIPQGQNFIEMFLMAGPPGTGSIENKTVTPPSCMRVGRDLGFDMRRLRHRGDAENPQLKQEARDSLKKILEMYPNENTKRRRRH